MQAPPLTGITMNLFQVVVTATLTTLAVITLSIAGVWAMWPKTAEASATVAAHASGWHDSSDGHCARIDTAHIDLGEAVVTAALDLNETQQAALEPITQAARRWRDVAQTTCEAADFSDLDASMATMETVLNQTSDAFTEVRPMISNFYATLSPEQQAKMEAFIHAHHGRHHGRRGHSWHGNSH